MTQRKLVAAVIVMSVAATGAATSTAGAADFPVRAPSLQALPVVQEYTSGWYLRGDLGWRRETRFSEFATTVAWPIDSKIHDVATAGVGGGYKAQWFRADVTLDYAGKAKFSGDSAILPAAFTGKFETFTALANLYVDLGTWGGFTPYIGVGAGLVTGRTFDYVPPSGIVTVDYQTFTNFAWAFMGGVSFCLTPKWLVDIGYRRLNVGDVSFNPLLQNSLTLKDVSTNEFRVGLRYILD